MAALGAGLLTLTLAACSGDEAPEPTPTTATQTDTPAAPTTTAPAPTTPPQTATATASPTETTEPASPVEVPTEGAGPDEALFLPDGFPVPEELTVTGDPTATADAWQVAFLVPDPTVAFDFYRTTLPEAGYELLPGTSETYSTEVFSGAILAQSDEHDVNLLLVDDEVEITITRR